MNTINKVKNVVYVAINFATGLTDLVLTVRKPNGTLVSPNPTITEQGSGTYTASYTPDALGTWQEKISSASNTDKVVRSYDVVAFDTTDNENAIAAVQTTVNEIATDTDTIITNVSAVKTELDTVNTTTTEIATDTDTIITNVAAVKSELDTVNTNVTTILNEVNPGGYFA